jgi:hypothetical protein
MDDVTPLALQVVDVDVLWRLIVASLAGGLGVSLAFSIVIYGATRFVDLRRDGRTVLAGAFALVAALALAAVFAGVIYGITVLAHKS